MVRLRNRYIHGDSYHDMGEAWCFIAIERSTKLILAFELGKRMVTSAARFIGKLANATDPEKRFQLTTARFWQGTAWPSADGLSTTAVN